MKVLALQGTYVRQRELRTLSYPPEPTNKRACDSVYAQRQLEQDVLDLGTFSSEVSEYAAATLSLNNQDVSVVSAYVRPGFHNVWYPLELMPV